ncbi:MAG: hypothetical protein QRY74_01050 [Chlamydia sp.]
MNPLSTARTNHPAQIVLLEKLSFGERSVIKSITDKNKHDQNQLQKELQQIQTDISSIQEYIASLSIQEMQSIPDSSDRFNAVIAFSAFKRDKRAKNQGTDFEEIFKLMEKAAYSSNNTLDFLFESAKTAINSFTQIDSYKPGNVPDDDLCRACACFKKHITQFYEQNDFYSYYIKNALDKHQNIINQLLELYQAEKEIKNKSNKDSLMLSVNELEYKIMKNYYYSNLKNELLEYVKYFKRRPIFLDQLDQYKIKLISQSTSDTKELVNRICDSIHKDIKNIDSKYTYMGCSEDVTIKIEPAIKPLQKLFMKYKNSNDQDLITSILLGNIDILLSSSVDIDDYFKEKILIGIINKKNIYSPQEIPDEVFLGKVNLDFTTIDDIMKDLTNKLWNELFQKLSSQIQEKNIEDQNAIIDSFSKYDKQLSIRQYYKQENLANYINGWNS